MRITLIFMKFLFPAMLIAASSGDLDPVTLPTQGIVSITSLSPDEIVIKCEFDRVQPSEISSLEDIPAVTRWLMIPGDALPSIKTQDVTYLDAVNSIYTDISGYEPESLPVEIGEPIVQRGVRLVPIKFNSLPGGHNGEIHQVGSIEVDISLPVDTGSQRRPRRVLDEMWGDLILNRGLPGRDQEDETVEGSYIYVIPDNNDVRNTIAPLINWRRQQGYNVREITVPEWGDADFVIQQLLLLDTPETPVDYILLAGDVTGAYRIPTIMRGIECDYYYSFLEGNDRIPDAAVGRLSYNSLSELERIVAKILTYEQRPDVRDPGWLHRAAVCAGSRLSGFSTILVSRWVRDELIAHDFTSIDTSWYTMGGRIGDFMDEQFNRGVSYVTYRGWTGLEDWSPVQAGALRNHHLPTAVLFACNSGDYAGQQPGFTEALLRAPGGAIAAIGVAGAQSRVNFNNAMMASFFRGVLDDGVYRIGWCLNRARLELMATYGTNENELTVDHSAWTNLMGDPATIIWRGTPRTIRIGAPQQVDYGAGRFNVSVVDAQTNQPVPNVRVGFYKSNEIVTAAYTNNDGQATIVFSNVRLSPGEADLTASGDKVIPVVSQVELRRPARTLAVQSVNALEDNMDPRQGNGNGRPEPNEVISLILNVINIGSQVIPGVVNCQLETESEYCEILVDDFRILNPLNPNAATAVSFLVALYSDFPDRENIPFTLTSQSEENVWTSEVIFRGYGARWEFIRTDIQRRPSPNDMPSFDIFLRNTGSINLGITQAHLVSESEAAIVISADAEYDSLEIDEIGSVGRAFSVEFGELTPYDADLPFLLELSCEGNYTGTIPFVISTAQLPVGFPTGPDDYGYYALDQQDFGLNLRPNFRWEEINPRLGGSGSNTGLLDQGEDDDQSVVLELPFTVSYYGHNYDRITVCTNGWAAFGEQAGYVDFRNMPIGSPQGPRAQLCPWWTDLYQPGIESGVYYYYDLTRHRYIIEWYRMRQWIGPGGPGPAATFQIILCDPDWHPNTSGDADIFFVYNEISHDGRVDGQGTPYATVGMGNPDDEGGLQLAFWNRFAPGATPPNSGVIYRIMTETTHNYALLTGTVRRLGDNAPVQGATVRATRGGWTFTDANGAFRINAIIAEIPQQVEVSVRGYNTALSEEFEVETGDSLDIAVTMRQPQARIDIEDISDSLDSGEMSLHHFNLNNPGNGRLTVSTKPVGRLEQMLVYTRQMVLDGTDEIDEFGDRLLSVPVTARTGDSRILGVAYDGDSFFVSGGDNGEATNLIYIFDEAGEYVTRVGQPIEDSWGMHDLGWNGTHLFGGVSEWIVKIDRSGRETSRIASPIIPARGLTLTPNGEYWITGEGQPFIRLSGDGEIIHSYPNSLNVYGLAWHPNDVDGFPLWIFSYDGQTGMALSKMDTSTGAIHHILDIEGEDGDRPGGIELTKKWDDKSWTLAAIIQNPTGDRLELFDAGVNLSWLTINPSIAVIDSNSSREFTVSLISDGLTGGEYLADVLVTHDAAGGEFRIPVTVNVEPVMAGIEPESPVDFALEEVYPNPTNGSAIIRFNVSRREQTELAIYDSQGRLVGTLVNRVIEPGYYSEVFDAAAFPAGVYIVRLGTGGETHARKFVLIK